MDPRAPYKAARDLKGLKRAEYAHIFNTYEDAFNFIVEMHKRNPYATHSILDSKGWRYYPEETRGDR